MKYTQRELEEMAAVDIKKMEKLAFTNLKVRKIKKFNKLKESHERITLEEKLRKYRK